MSKIQKGDYFTVKKWTSHKDNSYVGNVMLCVAQEGSMITGKFLKSTYYNVVDLSTNRVELEKLSKDYITDWYMAHKGKDYVRKAVQKKWSENYENTSNSRPNQRQT